MGFQDSKSNIYGDDGSTSTQAVLVGIGTDLYVASDGRPKAVISKACKDDDSTASATVLGGTQLLAKVFNSQAIVLSEAGKGETCQSTEMGILESGSNTYDDDDSTASDRVLGGTRLVAKFVGSKPGIYLAADEGETCQVCSLDSESNTSLYDGLAAEEAISLGTDIVSQSVIPMAGEGETCQTTDVCSLDSESNTHQDDDSTGGSQEFEGETYRRTKMDILESENNTHIQCEPFPRTDMDSERDTCRYDGLATKEANSFCTDIVSQAVIPMAGKVQGSSMESLPLDIMQDIVSRVPAESVLECKLVCKRWEAFIGGGNFTNMHLSRQLKHHYDGDDNIAVTVEPYLFFACRTDDPDEFITLLFHGGQLSDKKYIYNQNLKRIYHPPMHNELLCEHLVGSCNGLVCAFQLQNTILDPIYICNPLTREYVYLPPLVVNEEDVDLDYPDRIVEGVVDMCGDTACGFGYVCSSNEYKVVRIHYLDYNEGNVEVYTLGSGCGWRAIGKVSHRLAGSSGGRGTYANDAIYWILHNTLVAFDLAAEKFRLVTVPPCMQNLEYEDRYGLVALGRHLCLYVDKLHVEIWSFMENRDSKESWRLELDIDYEVVVGSRERNFKPIFLTKNGDIVFLYAESVLYSYDPKTTILKAVSNEASSDNFEAVEVIAHINTFVSLEAMGENSKRYTGRSRWDDVIDELDRVALGEEFDTTRSKLR